MVKARSYSESGQSPVPYGAVPVGTPQGGTVRYLPQSRTEWFWDGKGQSLVEVLVSLSIAAIVMSGITLAVIYSLRNTQFSKNQNLASQYAAEGIEIMRQLRDSKSSLSGFLGANNTSITSCLPQDSTGPINDPQPPLCGQNVGPKDIGSTYYIYIREVKIEPPDPSTECKDNYKVTVKVSWWDNACENTSNFCHKVNLISCLADRKNTVNKLLL